MKIGIFTDSYFPQVSGVSTSIRTLKEELESQGHEVIIFTTTDPKAGNDEKNIIRLTSIPFLSFKDRRIAVKGMNKALKEAKKQNIDIVHTHTEFSLGLTGKFVGYMLGIPTVHTYHTMYEKYLHYIAKGKVVKPKAVKIASRYFCNRTMGIIAPSQQMKDKLSSYNIYKEIRVIPTGVQIPERIAGIRQSKREELGIADSELVLLSLAGYRPKKIWTSLSMRFPKSWSSIPPPDWFLWEMALPEWGWRNLYRNWACPKRFSLSVKLKMKRSMPTIKWRIFTSMLPIPRRRD